MKHCVIFILIGLLVTSCIHGDYWDLGNGYSYCAKSICKQDEKGVDTLVLFPEIIDYAYNERYIVAHQNFDSAALDNDTVWFGKDIKYYQQMKKQKKIYWVIDKVKDTIYGPLDKNRYGCIVDSLKIQLALHKKQ